MIDLNVWLTLPDNAQVRVGRMRCQPKDRAFIAGFQYDPGYLEHPRAFALDPRELPLQREVIAVSPASCPLVFEDSLPDAWGRRLLARFHSLPIQTQYPASLLQYMGSRALGALSFGEKVHPAPAPLAGTADLAELVSAADRFERDEASMGPEDRELVKLFEAGSSPGGGRPKALIQRNGRPQLAKFPSVRDSCDMVRLEAASLDLAVAAALEPPRFTLEEVGDRPVLLVERFDVTEQGGRRHLVSLRTLLQASGYSHARYLDLFAVVRELTTFPREDLARLYRWAVFNALLGNTDDHLQNFAMLHDDAGWQLAPAYDLLPNTGGNVEHVLSYGALPYPPGRRELITLGKNVGLTGPAAEANFEQVHTAVARWLEAFMRWGVPQVDIERLGPDIKRRLARG